MSTRISERVTNEWPIYAAYGLVFAALVAFTVWSWFDFKKTSRQTVKTP